MPKKQAKARALAAPSQPWRARPCLQSRPNRQKWNRRRKRCQRPRTFKAGDTLSLFGEGSMKRANAHARSN